MLAANSLMKATVSVILSAAPIPAFIKLRKYSKSHRNRLYSEKMLAGVFR